MIFINKMSFLIFMMTADELDSFMYQTVGHNAIDLYAQAMDLPLYRGLIYGSSVAQGKVYTETDQDEVEDLYKLLKKIKVCLAVNQTYKCRIPSSGFFLVLKLCSLFIQNN